MSVGVSSCSSSRSPAPLARALAAALAEADQLRAPWRCTAPDLPALPPQSFPHGWEASGHTLSRAQAGDVTIGIVADTAGAAPPTLAALGRLHAAFDAAHADLVITLGGIGASQPELEAVLGTLADHAGYPLVALPGDLEPTAAHTVALAALRARGDAVVDGRLARWIELPGASIASLPGAGAAARLVAGDDGCAYTAPEISQILAELSARPGLRIAAAAEAPRHDQDGEPAGDLPVTAVIDLALAPTGAATRARSGGRDGAAVLLSPGIADATTRLPPTRGPSAGLLVLHGAVWSFRPLVDAK